MNEIPKYPKGDLRRMLMVLAVLHEQKGATLVVLAKKTGISKKTVSDLIETARTQAGVQIEKIDATYYLREIGPVLKIEGIKKALQGALNAPIIEPTKRAIGAVGLPSKGLIISK